MLHLLRQVSFSGQGMWMHIEKLLPRNSSRQKHFKQDFGAW